jgi:hypothetical protein
MCRNVSRKLRLLSAITFSSSGFFTVIFPVCTRGRELHAGVILLAIRVSKVTFHCISQD